MSDDARLEELITKYRLLPVWDRQLNPITIEFIDLLISRLAARDAEIAKLREALELVASNLLLFRKPGSLMNYNQAGMLAGMYLCDYCKSAAKVITDVVHKPNCLITKARAALAPEATNG
jgi:hypothetical protein